MKHLIMTALLLLALTSTAQAQSSISVQAGPYVGPELNEDRELIWSGIFAFDLVGTPKLGHLDWWIGMESIPLVSTGFQWAYEPDQDGSGVFLSFGVGFLPREPRLDLGADLILFRFSAGVMVNVFMAGWTHWSHAWLEGSHNPGLNVFFLGVRLTF